MGEQKLQTLLQASLAGATRTAAMKPSDLARVVVDTTGRDISLRTQQQDPIGIACVVLAGGEKMCVPVLLSGEPKIVL